MTFKVKSSHGRIDQSMSEGELVNFLQRKSTSEITLVSNTSQSKNEVASKVLFVFIIIFSSFILFVILIFQVFISLFILLFINVVENYLFVLLPENLPGRTESDQQRKKSTNN